MKTTTNYYLLLLFFLFNLKVVASYAQTINYNSQLFIRSTGGIGSATHYIICSDEPTIIVFKDPDHIITNSYFLSNPGCDTIRIDSIIFSNQILNPNSLNQKRFTYVESSKNIILYEGFILSSDNPTYPGHYYCWMVPPPELAGTSNIEIGYNKEFVNPQTATNYLEFGNELMLFGIQDTSKIRVYPNWQHPLLGVNNYYSLPLEQERGWYEYAYNTINVPSFPQYYPPSIITQDSSIFKLGKFITKTGMFGTGSAFNQFPWGLSLGFRFYPLAYEFLSSRYHTVPHLTRAGDSLLAIAFHDSTVINLNGINSIINRGEVLRVLLDTPGVWQANHPFSLVQISRHQQEDSVLYSSLFAYSVHPDSALMTSTWYTTEIVPDSTSGEQSYLNLVAPSNGIATVKLDGIALTSFFIPFPGDSLWSYAQIPVSSIQHKLEADSGVIAYAYQYSLGCGIGFYVGGLNMKNTVTGLSSLPLKAGIRIFPNPVHSMLYIEFDDTKTGNESNQLAIYSVEGRCVLKKNVNNNSGIQVDISSLENGLYFIELMAASGNFTARFIKN